MLDELDDLYVSLSENGLTAYVTINASYAGFPEAEEIFSRLKESSVVFGVDESAVKQIAEQKQRVIAVPVAYGKKPVDILNWHFDIENPNRPTITNQNRADFKNLNLYQFVKKGDVIVNLRASADTQPGMTVTGKKIPAQTESPLPDIANAIVDKDQNALVAAKDGYLMWEDDKLTLSDVFHVKGDVDYGTGNLKLKGTIIIDGDVRSGFRVETDSDIIINGTVDAAHVYSQHGNVTIKNGILGQGRAKVLCGGSLFCGYMQDAHVAVRGDVVLEKYAINCIISAGGLIRATENEGLIRGGISTADKGIMIRNAGSPRGVYTEFKIRNYGEDDSQSRIWKLSRTRSELAVRLSGLKKRRDFLELLNKNKGLSSVKKEEMSFVDEEIERLKEKLSMLEREEIGLQKEASRDSVKKEVRIIDTIYRNVSVDIGGLEYFCDSELQHMRIFKLNNELVLESLQGDSYSLEVSDKN